MYIPSLTLDYRSIMRQILLIDMRLILKLVSDYGRPLKLKLLIYNVKNMIMTSATE